MRSCDFKTSEASTKAWMRTNNAIDKFLNIIDENIFRKSNNKFSKFANETYNVKGKLFYEESGKAVPNKEMFKAIDKAKGFQEERDLDNNYTPEDINIFNRKVELLKQGMNVEVIFDDTIETSRVLGSQDQRVIAAGKPIILINPNRIFKTTAIHEFGHIFIDSFPEGLENKRLQKALTSLENTKLWNDVKLAYPDLSIEDLHKEILATAIGRQGSEIWDENNSEDTKTAWETFKNWIIDYLQRTFGINQNQIESLVKEMFDTTIQRDLLENLNENSMEERIARFIDESTQEEKKIESNLESVYEQIQARINIIFQTHYPDTREKRELENERRVKARLKDETTPFEKIKELKDLLDKYSTDGQINGIVKYTKWSRKQIYQMKSRVLKIKESRQVNPESIMELKEYNSAFALLNEVQDMIVSLHDRGEISTTRKNTFIDSISKINSERDIVNKELLSAQREIYANLMAKNSNLHETEYIEKYNRQWDKLQPQEAKNIWVRKQMEENKDEIEATVKEFYLALANKSIKDIDSFAGMFVNEKNISSTEIQVISRMNDAADLETTTFMQNMASSIKSNHDNFLKTHNSSDMSKKYEDFLEQNDKGNYSLISKYKPEFNEQFLELSRTASDPDIYNKKFADVTWNGLDYTVDGVTKRYSLHGKAKDIKINGEFIEYKIYKNQYSMPVREALAKFELRQWITKNTEEISNGTTIETIPASKWENPRYNSMSQEDKVQLQEFKQMINSADKLYKSNNSLISDVFGSKIYRLPGVTKSSMERLTEGNIGSAAIDKLTDMFRRKEDEFEIQEESSDDKMFRSVFADVSNREKLNVPIPYRAVLSSKEQSLDLHSILLMNLEGAKNYEQKKDIEAKVNTIIDVMGNRITPDFEGISVLAKMHGFSGDKKMQVNKSKDELPNDVKKAMDMVANRIYGIKEKSAGEIAGVNIQKAMSTYMGYASNVSLVGNYLNSIINATSGTVSNLIEVIGGETYNYKDWIQAKKNYWSDAKNIVNDIGSNIETSKTNLMMNYFNVMGSANAINNKFSNDSKVKSMMTLHSLRFLDHGGEHMMQGQTMYAVLNSIKVLNKKGEFLDENGNVVSDETKALTMDKAIEFKSTNGIINVTLKPFVEATTFSPLGGGQDKILLDTRGLIKKKTIDLYGVYDESIKAAAQREWWGKLIFFLKKWIEPSATRRLRGISKALKNSEDLRDVDLYYSEDMKQYQEGYYTTSIRFIAQTIKSMKGFQLELIAENFKNLNKHEKANIRRMAAETGMIALTVLAYSLAGGFDDEPDDDTLMARYLLSKEISELTYFLNPGEAVRLMSSPTAALGVVNRNIAILSQLVDPLEEYQSGVNAGRNKLYVKLRKSTPFIASFLEKDLETALRFQQNN